MSPESHRLLESEDFSLVLGGPLYQLLRRSHLLGDAFELVRRRIVALTLLAWLPLLLLSLLEGRAWGGQAAVPFLCDVEAHARFLLALPLLILAELVVHERLRPLVQQFRERNLVPESALPRFEAAVGSALRLRNSVVAELLLIAFVFAVGLQLWRHYLALSAPTWYATPTPDGLRLTLTGWWYAYVSLPLFQFLLVRWYYRIFIWTRFLWQASRLPLALVPAHPDGLGGLGFLSGTVFAFSPLAVAHGALLAGPVANRILYLGARLPSFLMEIAAIVAFVLCLVIVPLLAFSGRLAAAKRAGIREYGKLAERYARAFDAKWLRGGPPEGAALLGSPDLQSLSDLGHGYALVKAMRLVPITRDAVLRLVVASLAPFAPLLLTMMSLEELLGTLFGVLR